MYDRILITIPPELHIKTKDYAGEDMRSKSSFICKAIKEKLERMGAYR